MRIQFKEEYILDGQIQVKERAVQLAKDMENEDGVTGAVRAFHKHLPHKNTEPRKNTEPGPVPTTTSRAFSISRCFGCS